MADRFLVSHHRPTQADYPPEGRKRYRLLIAYDGTDYCGWQRQDNGLSVQQVMEETLSDLMGEEIRVIGSSRTDAGVHARGLSAHFDSATRIPAEKIAFALNTRLPGDVRVMESSAAPEGFHARFSACGKVYRYSFWNGRHMDPLSRRTMAHVPVPMTEERMAKAAQDLMGTHDFAAFAASGSVAKTTVRTIWRAKVRREGDVVTVYVLGDGFLYNMVRIIAGTLAEIGVGRRPEDAVKMAIETGNRLCLGPTAPACGLCLERALYAGEEEQALAYFADSRVFDRI